MEVQKQVLIELIYGRLTKDSKWQSAFLTYLVTI